jgi:hypothetical protein
LTPAELTLEAGTWQLRARPESRFEFTPGRPIVYWVVLYRPTPEADWLSAMLEHVGEGRPVDGRLWQCARDDYAERRGLAAA